MFLDNAEILPKVKEFKKKSKNQFENEQDESVKIKKEPVAIPSRQISKESQSKNEWLHVGKEKLSGIKTKTNPQEILPSINVNKSTKDKLSSNINPDNIIKHALDGHALVLLQRARVKGFCVSCIKSKSDPNFKKTMKKITTFCPKCPGGSWICEQCFDSSH